MKSLTVLFSALLMLAFTPSADAHHFKKPPHAKAAKVHYGPKPYGYWRKGPEHGYGFRFSSYRGDPFGRDDYYDGDACYYVHHRNFCDPRPWTFNIWRSHQRY